VTEINSASRTISTFVYSDKFSLFFRFGCQNEGKIKPEVFLTGKCFKNIL